VRNLLALALAAGFTCASTAWAQSATESAGCDSLRQYWAALQSGSHLAGAVTADDVAAGPFPGATPLNTNSWLLYVPALALKWPNAPMRIDLATPAVPDVQCQDSMLTVTTTVHLAFSVLPSTGQAPAFTLSVPFSYDAAFRFDPNHPFRWTTASLSISVVATSIGPIDLSLLQGVDLRPYLGLAHL
jgi:hypothetical protein